jgi:hypothetical protein
MKKSHLKQKTWAIQMNAVSSDVLMIISNKSKLALLIFKKLLRPTRSKLVTVISTALLFFSTQIFSFEGWLNTHLASIHYQSGYDYNEKNFGLGLSYTVSPEFDLITGFYENSYNKTSSYVGFTRHTANNSGFSVGISAVLVTGYEDTRYTSAKVIAMFIPQLTYSLKKIRVELGVIPSFSKRDYKAITTLTIGTKF